jgi:hypothetical protein
VNINKKELKMGMDYWPAIDEVSELVEDLIGQYHPDAATANIFYQFKEKASKSEWESGIVCSVKLVPDSMKEALKEPYIFIVSIAADAWKELSPDQRRMKMDSALCKIGFKLDEGGDQKLDKKTGEPIWAIRQPDLVEHSEIVQRYDAAVLCGTNSQLLETFERIKKDEAAEKKRKKEEN